MSKVLIRTRHAYPLFHFGDGVYVRQEPSEVTLDEWTQAQIDAGLLIVETSAEPEADGEPARPQSRRGKKAEQEA